MSLMVRRAEQKRHLKQKKKRHLLQICDYPFFFIFFWYALYPAVFLMF